MNPGGGQTYSLTLQILILMTVLTLLPAILLMMTAFTRIVIVLAILRQAIGAGQTPPNQVLVGLALFEVAAYSACPSSTSQRRSTSTTTAPRRWPTCGDDWTVGPHK